MTPKFYSRYLRKNNENTCLLKNLYINVLSNKIQNSLKGNMTKVYHLLDGKTNMV